jgi:hypothetical protein
MVDLVVIQKAYGWTVADDGELCGLVAGDMGYEDTGIMIPEVVELRTKVEALELDRQQRIDHECILHKVRAEAEDRADKAEADWDRLRDAVFGSEDHPCINRAAAEDAAVRVRTIKNRLRDAVEALTKGHEPLCLCAGCEALRPF